MKEDTQLVEAESEYESLKKELIFLRGEIVRLTSLRDELNLRECPRIRAEYDARIGGLELRVYDARAKVQKLKRVIEILQAARNRQEEKTAEEAQKDAGQEYQAYEDDLKKKADDIHTSQAYCQREAEKDQAWQEDQDVSPDEENDDSKQNDDDHAEKDASKNPNDEEQEAEDENADAEEDSTSKNDEKEASDNPRFHSRAEELRYYYRKLVKALHPDTNPNQTEEEKQMFRDTVEAYRTGDLERLKELYKNLSASGQTEDFQDTPEDIEKMHEILDTLRAKWKRLQEEIQHIKTTFPYIAKDFLADDEAVSARQKELASYLSAYEKQYEELTEVFQKMQQGGNPA